MSIQSTHPRATRRTTASLAVVALVLLQCPSTTKAFISLQYRPSSLSVSPWILPTTSTADLSVTTTTATAGKSLLLATSTTHGGSSGFDSSIPAYVRQPPLSVKETKGLLQQAWEWKRLKELERNLARQSPSLTLPYLSVRAKEAGYEDNTEEYEKAMTDGIAAREILVTRNMGLVYFCVADIIGKRTASTRNLSREDLIQEGALGLSRAIDKYKPNMGTKFSTYAVYWIRAAILRCLAEHDDYMMRIPEHVTGSISKMRRAAKRLGISQPDTMSASWKEAHAAKLLAEEAGLTHKQIESAIEVQRRRRKGSYVSLEDSSEFEQSKYFAKLSSSYSEEGDMSDIDVDKMKSELSKYLRPKEMEAISWRYGLLSGDATSQQQQLLQTRRISTSLMSSSTSSLPIVRATRGKKGEAMSFKEVGNQMSVSAEYCRRLCHQALDKLRKAAEEGQLSQAQLYFA